MPPIIALNAASINSKLQLTSLATGIQIKTNPLEIFLARF